MIDARPWFYSGVALLGAAVMAPTQPIAAQDAWDAQRVIEEETFVTPPSEILDAVLAPRHLNINLSEPAPGGAWFVHMVSDGPVTMDRFSRPFDELGGLFVDRQAHRTRRLTNRSAAGLQIVSTSDGRIVDVEVPRGARVSTPMWAPNGSALAFFVFTDDETHIYTADPATGRSRQLTRSPVLATLNTSFDWSADGSTIATVLIPEDRADRPVESAVPQGPSLKVTEDGENRLRTYASLMTTPHHKALLEWHATGQAVLIDVTSRDVQRLGDPDMIEALDLSPDGAWVRVTRMTRPFSYLVPVSRFGTVQEIWNAEGTPVATVQVDSLDTGVIEPGQANTNPFGSGQSGKREIAWRGDGAGLTYLEREEPVDSEDEEPIEADEGDDEQAGAKDRVMLWAPPFGEDDQSVVFESSRRITSHRYSADHSWLFLSEAQGQRTHEYAVELATPDETYTLARYENDDFYARPGALLPADGRVPAVRNAFFRRFGVPAGNGQVVATSEDGSAVYYVGTEYARDPMSEGPRSFLDRVEIRTGDKERVYRSENDAVFESLRAVLDPDEVRLAVMRESPTEVPQGYLRTGSDLTQLTENRDYTPDLTAAPREQFVVERPDGFQFRVTVNLPPGYQPGTRLPAMFWFYPREYEDQESYDEGARTYNKNAFPSFGVRSMEYLVKLGYAVVEPDAPIIGPQGRMNDNYEHDLRNNLAAVIDELDRRELIDRSRLGIGGHSYGAFSTANAMVHTPFFKAGIAGDGNYNRTFTPLAFQSERRILWEAKDVYLGMSPFLHANNLTGALLMYHGMHDQNVGTAPEHTPRLFHALNGLGKTAAMYMYPFEDHGPATRETLLDLWGRWTAWLHVHVKNAGTPNTVS